MGSITEPALFTFDEIVLANFYTLLNTICAAGISQSNIKCFNPFSYYPAALCGNGNKQIKDDG